VLIYPYWSGLQRSLPAFDFGDDMSLWVLPFDLDADSLVDAETVGLPLGYQANLQAPMELSA
jgi:5-methylcytosine-specific restriction enzyme subunit McrC